MNPTPEQTTPEKVQKESGYQSLQPVKRPEYWGVDLDPSRRPGVPMMREDPQPWPNTRFPPERQSGEPSSPRHGRPNKPLPPVFGTAVPLRGLSGAIRKLAYSYPDHYPRHWMLMLLGDRVDAWTYRARRLAPVVAPLAVVGFIASLGRR
jgi:hypothetical protein